MQSQINKNWIRVLLIVVLISALSLIVKLYQVQIVKGDDFDALSKGQYVLREDKNSNRASIIFQYKDGKEFFAAVNKTGYNLEINPTIIQNPEDTFNILSTFMELDPDDFFEKANKIDDVSEIIVTRLDVETAERISELELRGVILSKEKWRVYSGKTLAAQTLGFLSYSGHEIKGQYGLERYYDDVLSKDSESLYVNFFVELFSGIKDTLGKKNFHGSIITTIEPNVQTFTEQTIKKVQSDWSADKTGAIVMNPKTGEIISMALAPTFDVNIFNESENISVFNNDIVESVYEMGSIIKPITVAIGLDTEKITPNTTYNDKGSMTLNNRTFYNYDKEARGVVSMQEVLNQSLNTGVAYIVQQVGTKKFGEYMKELLGEQTGIDLPNEASPLVDNLNSPREIEYATASFGQGIAISPIQTITALSALGNGGYIPNPHIVKEVKNELGVSRKIVPNPTKQIFSKETSESISRMLATVVDEALLNGEVALPNHSIAAKTGTAQLVDKDTGKYYDDRYLHSFFGYFPAYDPKFIILLYTVEPKGAQYASQTLTMPFMDIAKYLINYYEIEPDR